MAKTLTLLLGLVVGLTLGIRSSQAQPTGGVSFGDIANLGNFGLGTGLMGGGETMPGAILIKIRAEVQCTNCTLEEMGVEQTPGDLHQLSYDKTHMVVKVIKAEPDIAWELTGQRKLFLRAGENPAQLKRLLDEAAPGKQIDVTGGITPSRGDLIPLTVNMK